MTQPNNTDALALIKDKLDIVETVSEYVILKKAGRNYSGLCPFHKEKTPSFSVNPQKQIFKCFGCGEGGDAISFLMKVQNKDFKEVISDLAQKYGIEMPQFNATAKNTEIKKQILQANKLACEYYTKALLNNRSAQKALDYLKGRGITDDVIKEYQLGASTKQPDELMTYLKKEHRLSFEVMEKAGLVIQRSNGQGYVDRFRNRLMIPIFDENDNPVGFGARALDEGQNPKYLNSSDTLVYNKSKVMYGLNKAKDAIRDEDAVIIMEGYFDVISAQVAGVKNVVATSGTSLTQGHLKNISRYMNSRRIYLAFDSDKAGLMATKRGADVIKESFEGLGEIRQYDESYGSVSEKDVSCEIRVITSSEGKDPDEFIKSHGVDSYKKLINDAPLLIDFEIDSIIKVGGKNLSPQDKAKKVREVVKILSQVKNKVIQSEYIKSVACQLDVEPNAISMELTGYNEPKNSVEPGVQRIVKKSLNKSEIAQKKILSCYFTDGNNISMSTLNNYLDDVEFTEPTLLSIKGHLKELSQKAENKEQLLEMAIDALTGHPDSQKELIAIAEDSLEISSLSQSLLRQYIEETISFIKRFQSLQVKNELKNRYYEAQNDETSSLKLQYEVREKLKQVNNSLN